ncbi:ABC transporter [Paracoccus sediminis]|uniref:ABC transporter n=1 Tax=Paracoccus sediminis TaxID=1214787 RepID=A0A238VEB1_9RHOB|nr:ABC transporter [Paracoccus sediminis]TBN51951.1 ABC transporter [Paracoccus sediminis]SNR32377.1 ABC-type polysaccharide/polyol phosphate export permease [Paracoccus sediminis]
MFNGRRNRTILQAAGTTVGLIYHQTVYNLRNDHRNAVVGLLLTVLQSAIFLMAFLLIYLIMGVRNSPIRGDFTLYLLSGIFMFMVHVQASGAVAGSHSVTGGLVKHEPLSPAILIVSAALAVLYRQTISCIAILWLYHVLIAPIQVEYWPGCLAMYLLSWFSGACIGLVFLGIRPWSPRVSKLVTTAFQRINMFASGKMFVANVLPNALMPWFVWNPLFHIIDQQRGFLFINYSPLKTDPLYALWFSLAAMMIGLLINFTTRKYESLSWSAAD